MDTLARMKAGALRAGGPAAALALSAVVGLGLSHVWTAPHRASAAQRQDRRARAHATAHRSSKRGSHPATAGLTALAGHAERYTVQPGDTLLHIARAHSTDPLTLARLNGLKAGRVRPGMRLLLPTLRVLPTEVQDGIVLNVPERTVYVFRDGGVRGRYPVAVGKHSWETPLGTYRLMRKVLNPTWVPPDEMVEREGVATRPIGPGRHNPIGDRWMGWSAPDVGFHTTYSVNSVGKLASHACVRLYPEAAHAMFGKVYLGMPIYSLNRPVLLGKGPDGVYLSVWPDVYHAGTVSMGAIRKRLSEAGLLGRADLKVVAEALRRQDGYPRRIAPLPSSVARAAG